MTSQKKNKLMNCINKIITKNFLFTFYKKKIYLEKKLLKWTTPSNLLKKKKSISFSSKP